MVDSAIKTPTQCAVAVKNPISISGIIRKGVKNKTSCIIMLFYKSDVNKIRIMCTALFGIPQKSYCNGGKDTARCNRNCWIGANNLQEIVRTFGFFKRKRKR